jgi:flavin reductase (DIM6/NTAB) family NADH-FMN oxidoreductase RutF
MNDKSLKKIGIDGNLLSPLPVVLVGVHVNLKPNFLVIGYICPFDFGKYIFLSMYKKRYSNLGIHENMTFSVNIPTEELLPQTEICGSKSGRNFDKSSLFNTFYGELKNAPMISECPVNIECQVSQILDYGPNEGIIGKVIKSYVDPQYYVGNKLDWRKIDPLIWVTGGDFNYYQLGKRIISEEVDND